MFTKKTQTEPTKLETVINTLLSAMETVSPSSEEYSAMADQVAKLYKLKETDSPDRVSKDALIAAGASILGILLILNFERLGVVTSKAVGFVTKPR